MSQHMPGRFDLQAFRRALETSDAKALIGADAEDAAMEMVDHNRPPRSPMRQVGRPAIATFWRDIRAPDDA